MKKFSRTHWTLILTGVLIVGFSFVTSRSAQVYAEERYQELQPLRQSFKPRAAVLRRRG